MWLQLVNKGLQSNSILKTAVHCSKWLIKYLCGQDVSEFLYKEMSGDINESIEEILRNNKTKYWIEEYKEILANALIHNCTLLALLQDSSALLDAIQFSINTVFPMVETVKDCAKLYQSLFKFYVRAGQALESMLIKEYSKSVMELLLQTRLRMVECKIKGFVENPHETLEVMICSLYSLDGVLSGLKKESSEMQHLVKEFLKKYDSLAQNSVRQLGFCDDSVTEFYHQLSKCYLAVTLNLTHNQIKASESFKEILSQIYTVLKSSHKTNPLSLLRVVCTGKTSISLAKQLLWPVCLEIFSLVSKSSSPSLIEKQMDNLIRLTGEINEAIWDYCNLKDLFNSLSSKENTCVYYLQEYLKVVGCFERILSALAVNDKFDKSFAETVETKFLLLLKLYLALRSEINMDIFDSILYSFEVCKANPKACLNMFKRYSKIGHLLLTEEKACPLVIKLFAMIINGFTSFYCYCIHANTFPEGINDFAIKLVKISAHVLPNESLYKFASTILNVKPEPCQLLENDEVIDVLVTIFKEIPKGAWVPLWSIPKLNHKCELCASVAIDLYILQCDKFYHDLHEFPDSLEVTAIFQRYFELFGNSSIMQAAIIKLSEIFLGKSAPMPLRAFATTLGTAVPICTPLETFAKFPQGDVIIKNICILEHIIRTLENAGYNKLEVILQGCFQILDMKLAILRAILEQNSKEGKWVIFNSPQLAPLHRTIYESAIKIYSLLSASFGKLFGGTVLLNGDESFRTFYDLSIGNARFVSSVAPNISNAPLSIIAALGFYGNEAVHMLRYLGLYKESQVILQYLVMVQFCLKSVTKGCKVQGAYDVVVLRYLTLLHELLEGYCGYIKDRKSKMECLNYVLKCNEHYKENVNFLTRLLQNGPVLLHSKSTISVHTIIQYNRILFLNSTVLQHIHTTNVTSSLKPALPVKGYYEVSARKSLILQLYFSVFEIKIIRRNGYSHAESTLSPPN
eukprot:TRINITY_DN64415_c0_g1_i1.p1 TRINITY_DN64415_c0_g1~~TRINITY_DN64415_c0_g1_i1.p1  ORF type:complete len:969 (-),score=54.93 TRINITY_DN64415_c0_g1_i1:4801-7707(-)